MSEKAKSILAGFQELRKFCRELSLLLMTADGMMREHGWSPVPRTSVTGNKSGRVDDPEWWLPTEFSRFYQNNRHPQLLPYVAVLVHHLEDEDEWPIDVALLSAGCLVFKKTWAWNGEYWWSRSHLDMQVQRNDGTICRENPNETWDDEEPPEGVIAIVTFARPLDEVVDSETLRAKLVDPLLKDVIAQEAARLPSRPSTQKGR